MPVRLYIIKGTNLQVKAMMWGAGTFVHCWWECKLCGYALENSKRLFIRI